MEADCQELKEAKGFAPGGADGGLNSGDQRIKRVRYIRLTVYTCLGMFLLWIWSRYTNVYAI